MRPLNLTLLSGLAALAVAASASGQTSSSTPVIGYYKQTVPVGSSLWNSGFITKTAFQGVASSVSGTTVTQLSANWTPSAFSGEPHYLEIVEGPWEGLVVDIEGNTGTTLTLSAPLGAFAGLGATPKYAIRKHATLGGLFGAGSGLVSNEDYVTIYDPLGNELSFFHDGSNWRNALDNSISDAREIYPGQGFILTCANQRTVTFGGNEVCYVKTTKTRLAVYAATPVNLAGLVNPLAGDLFSLGQASLASLTANADYVTTYDTNGSTGDLVNEVSYFYDGATLRNAATNAASNSVERPIGSAFIISPAADGYYVQDPIHPIN